MNVDAFYKETNTVYEFCCRYWHGHTCLLYRDVTTGTGDTLVQSYEKNGPIGTDHAGRVPSRSVMGM